MPVEKHTAATKRKMSASHPKRPVIAVSVEAPHDTRVFESTRAAVKQGLASSNIVACCRGRLPHCYGYYWRYADEFESVQQVLAEAMERAKSKVPRKKIHGRPVVGVDPVTRSVKTYECVSDVTKDGLSRGGVSQALQGHSPRSGGMYWRYAEDFESVEQVLAEEATT